jgi:hypothetical protein
LKNEFPELKFVAERDMFDYIYDAKEFSSLVGKKWNGQRNYINRFKKTYPNHSVHVIETSEDVARVREFFRFLKTSRLKDFPAAFEGADEVIKAAESGSATTSKGELPKEIASAKKDIADAEAEFEAAATEFATATLNAGTKIINSAAEKIDSAVKAAAPTVETVAE